MTDLPESLARKPNIPWHEQTLDQLRAEYKYWDDIITSATSWGAHLSAADGFRRACKVWIERREKELENHQH